MSELLLDVQGAPATPASGQVYLYPNASKQYVSKDDTGRTVMIPGLKNWNASDVVANAADTYLTGSALAIPAHGLQAGTVFKWRFAATKTAAGIATPVWTVRVGTNGTTADTARITLTGVAQTAAVDAAFIELTAILRTIGASGVMAGILCMNHHAGATGFANSGNGNVLQATSAGFDTTVANLIVGVSVNPGAAGVWTHQIVKAELLNC